MKKEAAFYLEGNKNSAISTSLPKWQNKPLRAPGKWVFNNEQDSYGGELSETQTVTGSVAQTNIWNYVLHITTMKALSYGGTSIEGNLLRWSDIITNYNKNSNTTATSFKLYLPGKRACLYDLRYPRRGKIIFTYYSS